MPSVLHLWCYLHTQGHLGFLLPYFLGFLLLGVSYLCRLIFFELIFVKGVRSVFRGISFFVCVWMSTCFLLFVDSVISALFYCLCFSSRYQLTICGSVSRLSSLFMDLFGVLCQYHTSWLLKLFNRSLRSWSWLYQSSGFVPLLQFELANLDFFVYPYKSSQFIDSHKVIC